MYAEMYILANPNLIKVKKERAMYKIKTKHVRNRETFFEDLRQASHDFHLPTADISNMLRYIVSCFMSKAPWPLILGRSIIKIPNPEHHQM